MAASPSGLSPANANLLSCCFTDSRYLIKIDRPSLPKVDLQGKRIFIFDEIADFLKVAIFALGISGVKDSFFLWYYLYCIHCMSILMVFFVQIQIFMVIQFAFRQFFFRSLAYGLHKLLIFYASRLFSVIFPPPPIYRCGRDFFCTSVIRG